MRDKGAVRPQIPLERHRQECRFGPRARPGDALDHVALALSQTEPEFLEHGRIP
jgi:hypothetical protein